ncbi:APG7-like ubiquitin activating enzyme E1 [Cryptosporidium sp. chipmunk genotype I]|uniref:APG7-like ubiquitin activating enzyme E1 n=1 Tax=Cryptosporidium sp. chipmunk genotype I TaxID=1280935 RepID=UPI003519F678|nr:APG7-like ubiquitin activating enzyme E1 [Cryptosporidium sp. chipmunk genotype I]
MSAILNFNDIEHDHDTHLESAIENARKWINNNLNNQEKFPFTFNLCIYFDFKTQIVYYSAFFPNINTGFNIKSDKQSELGIKIISNLPEYSSLYINLNNINKNSNSIALLTTLKERVVGNICNFNNGKKNIEQKERFDCPWFFSTLLTILLFEDKYKRPLSNKEIIKLLKESSSNEDFEFGSGNCFITNKHVKNIVTISEKDMKELQSDHVLLFDLKNYLSPHELQQRLSTMNIDLIKWRLIPNFEQIHFKYLKFLIIGSGTLGCSVARNLIGWGIRNFKFIDHSKVSLNNPMRQCLFTLEDAKNKKNKALAAVERLRYICPDIHAEGIDFEIPILGDSTLTPEQFLNSVNETKNNILDSDVVMLLTDNKESRWLPTVLIGLINRYHNRKRPILCITVGLGFDSFIVVRNTFTETDDSSSGCYFCGDFSINSKNNVLDIPVDQQCSVVRMGASYFASSIAVELIMNLSQHPLTWNAPHLNNASNKSGENKSLLGTTPQCIRGFLADFSFCTDPIQRNKSCIACSDELINQIHKDEANTLSEIFINPREVESISGLSNFKSKMEKSMIENFN